MSSESSVWAYSDLVDKTEAILPHRLLPFQLHVDSRLGLGSAAWQGLVFGAGGGLLEGLWKRDAGGVFTRQVAHLAHRGELGVDEGAEPAHPLWSRKKLSGEQ